MALAGKQVLGMHPASARQVVPVRTVGSSAAKCVRGVPLLARKNGKSISSRICARATEEMKEVALGGATAQVQEANWVPVCLPEELPKGVRKEVEIDERPVLLFWYRNQIYCIESRSPAEGAYSEGFIKAKFTQDYCIECPGTGSLFSLKDGSIVSWYPNNAVLRALTPKDTCRNMEIFPVKLAQDAIYVDISKAQFASTAGNRGGAGTSIDNNNVFTVQPTVYFEGMDPTQEQATLYQDGPAQSLNPVTVIISTVGVGALAVSGTAIAIYLESLPLLVAVWVVLGGAAAYTGYQYVNRDATSNAKQ